MGAQVAQRGGLEGAQGMKRVVIAGGGFAGVSTAQTLAKLLRNSGRLARPGQPNADDAVEVVLLNRDNYFVFQPLLADILSATIETTHVVVPLRRMLRGVEIEVGVIESIDTAGASSSCGVAARRRGDRRIRRARHHPRQRHGLSLRARDGRARGRHPDSGRRVLPAQPGAGRARGGTASRRMRTTRAAADIVVVGGGSTGVEVAAELHDLFETAPRRSPPSRRSSRASSWSTAGRYLLNSFGESLGKYTTRRLAKSGVELVLIGVWRRVEADRVVLDDGTEIASRRPSSPPSAMPPSGRATLAGSHDDRGWILPMRLSAARLEHVWALGDCASIVDPKNGRPMPATAQHAIREGPHAARNVFAALDGRPATPFSYAQLGMLVSLGRYRGVGEILGIKVSGLIAWIAWRGYYLLRLPTWDRKIRVAVDWTLDWFLRRDVVEINVRRSRTTPGGEDELYLPD